VKVNEGEFAKPDKTRQLKKIKIFVSFETNDEDIHRHSFGLAGRTGDGDRQA
jgi:hypothetical protein